MAIATDLATISFPTIVISSLPAPMVITLVVISKLLSHLHYTIGSLNLWHWINRLSINDFFGSQQEVPFFPHLTSAFSPLNAAYVAEFS